MGFVVRIPGAAARPGERSCGTFPEALAHRESLWRGAMGGQSLVIVEEETGKVVRPCGGCRGEGTVPETFDETGGGRGAAPVVCEGCGGAGWFELVDA